MPGWTREERKNLPCFALPEASQPVSLSTFGDALPRNHILDGHGRHEGRSAQLPVSEGEHCAGYGREEKARDTNTHETAASLASLVASPSCEVGERQRFRLLPR